jgi:hypothetical protein
MGARTDSAPEHHVPKGFLETEGKNTLMRSRVSGSMRRFNFDRRY